MKQISLVCALVLLCLGATYAQRTVVGSVTDDSGAPLIGATVLVKNTTVGTVTDIDGQYSINVPAGESTLEISYIGYNTREIELGASNVVNVTLSEGVTLETAVVTSLGISKDRKALGYSVEQVGGEDLVSSRETNVVNALAGRFQAFRLPIPVDKPIFISYSYQRCFFLPWRNQPCLLLMVCLLITP
ncbi:MAG: carboxypeptidase-like regulatory domain-containing protein [Saprospiraceae bacterium]